MNEQWQYQLRVYLTDDLADVARSDRNNPALRPLTDILDKHRATLVNQFDAFVSYVVEAEEEGPENFPLLQPLLGGKLVTRMSRHDTNQANNLQVPSQYRL